MSQNSQLDNVDNQVVEYVYDAWGNHTVGGSNVALGNKNPFRYRSYFYDTETDLYFLKTRYYDPAIGRFINMDSVAYADPETVNGLNLYAYCGNNPVMYIDPDGHSLLIIFLILVATTITGGVIGGVLAADQDKTGWSLGRDILLGAAIGFAAGGAFLALTGVVAGAIWGASAPILGGVKAKMVFSIGALAFDFIAFIVAPIFGFTMEAIDYEAPGSLPLPQKPQPTPPHPYNKKRSIKLFYNSFL